jgi:hypothetical protein
MIYQLYQTNLHGANPNTEMQKSRIEFGLIIDKSNWIGNYLCANAADKSSLVASVDIMVVICPTLWSNLARPERRRDFRKMAPINYNAWTLSWSIEKLFIDLQLFELRDLWS